MKLKSPGIKVNLRRVVLVGMIAEVELPACGHAKAPSNSWSTGDAQLPAFVTTHIWADAVIRFSIV